MSTSSPRTRVERAMRLNNGKPVTQNASSRNCAFPGCATRLSRYNPNPSCAAHGGWSDASTRRNRDIL